jgi:hypothetical protein
MDSVRFRVFSLSGFRDWPLLVLKDRKMVGLAPLDPPYTLHLQEQPMSATASKSALESPLEQFLRDYLEQGGGVWDEVEPQVYDVLLPPGAEDEDQRPTDRGILRIAFDPEALPENPGSQLASFGTPLVDGILADAVERGRRCQAYLNGLNLSPYDLAGRIRRGLTLAEGLALEIQRVRALNFPQAVFWFRATFTSDQKEDEILPVAIDLHSGREVRHLERLLDEQKVADEPAQPLADARRSSVAAAYPLARQQVVRTLTALANTRRRELGERLDRQVSRMNRYYADLRSEIQQQADRAARRGEDQARSAARRQAIDREEGLRVSELRQKSTLRVQLRLVHLLLVHQPKLLIQAEVATARRPPFPLELVWDPLSESLEAASCPQCGRPTFAFQLDRLSRLVCPQCTAIPRTAK